MMVKKFLNSPLPAPGTRKETFLKLETHVVCFAFLSYLQFLRIAKSKYSYSKEAYFKMTCSDLQISHAFGVRWNAIQGIVEIFPVSTVVIATCCTFVKFHKNLYLERKIIPP